MADFDPFSWLGGQDPFTDQSEAQSKSAMDALEKRLELARKVHAIFAQTPDGIDVLQTMRDLTIELPLMQISGSLVQGEVTLSPADWAYIREGQNSVIRFLEGLIHLAENPPEIEKQEEDETDV